jgi:hypothetical protein
MKMKVLLPRLGFILLAALLVFLTFNRHSRSGYFNYHSEIWADKAGYYVYLPAALKYNFNPESFPQDMDKKTGHGFTLENKVFTKYTYGVALLQMPFYLLADIFAEQMGFERDGFSPIYHWAVNVAAVFYLMFGLLLLFRYLRDELPSRVVFLTLGILLLGTNLYYYAIDETGMSHVYSFFLFSAFLYLLQRSDFLSKPKTKHIILIGFVSGLIVLIRPTNVVFLLTFFYLRQPTEGLLLRIKPLLKPKISGIIALSAFLVFVPQLMYWKYVSGSYIMYTYSEEGFYWLKPMILETWFSPNNGLFIYTPLYLVIMAAFAHGLYTKNKQSISIAVTFFVISYIFSCWHDWAFGCSFGSRSFIEYLVLFSIPVGYLMQHISHSGLPKKMFFWLVVLVFAGYNLKMTYTYDECFYGSGAWDWKTFTDDILLEPTR